jgi:photosystem II stability/assembly factor-like uncharacterized protein
VEPRIRLLARLGFGALAVVVACGVVGVAVRDRVDSGRAPAGPPAGALPLPLVSELGPVVGAQLLDGAIGWALTADRLAWTDSGGSRWRTITPPAAAGRQLLTAFFLDRETGWLVAGARPDGAGPSELTGFRTTDGGGSWRQAAIGSANVARSEDGTGPLYLSFVDGRHGWLLVTTRLPGQTAEQESGTLLRTSDGGRTWGRLPDLPDWGAIRFATGARGWQVSSRGELRETRDAGRTWRPVAPPPPVPGREGRPWYAGPPTVFDDGRGFVPVWLAAPRAGVTTGGGFSATTDGGATWGAPSLAPPAAGDFPVLTVADPVTLVALDRDQATVARSQDGGQTWTTHRSDLAGTGFEQLRGMTFADATSGWLLSDYLEGCDCDSRGAVLGTRSSGRSWSMVFPEG